jgi:hypothetical protein
MTKRMSPREWPVPVSADREAARREYLRNWALVVLAHIALLYAVLSLLTWVPGKAPSLVAIYVLLLVSHLEEARAGLVRRAPVQGIVCRRTRFALKDLVGLPRVGREAIHHLETMSQADHLLGAEVVFVGLHAQPRAEVVQVGADLRSLSAQRDLQSGIKVALARLGRRIVFT